MFTEKLVLSEATLDRLLKHLATKPETDPQKLMGLLVEMLPQPETRKPTRHAQPAHSGS